MHLYIKKHPTIEVDLARDSKNRMKGLMFQSNLSKGILLKPCNWIHTFFMKEPIDVIYLDKNNKIVKCVHSMKPWRIGSIVFKAKTTLELPGGFIKKHCLEPNQLIELK